MAIAVCILFYEKPEQTIECIRSFVPSGTPVFVLNNGSSAAASVLVENFCASHEQVRLIASSFNQGVSGGRNVLIENTGEDLLLFVDNDIVVNTPDWVSRFTSHAEKYPAVEAFVPRLLNLHENEYVTYTNIAVENGGALLVPADEPLTNNFPGGAALVRRELFSRIGCYDERLFVGGEDFELALRGVLSGAPVISLRVDDVELVHEHRIAQTSRDISAVRQRYDIDCIADSFGIIKQIHGITVRDDWRKWVEVQLNSVAPQKSILDVIGSVLGRNNCPSVVDNSLFSVPASSSLFMTDRCNLACQGCRRSQCEPGVGGEMSLATVRQIMHRYPGLAEFCIAGFGEPTLCPDFTDIIDFLKSRRAYVGIISNGLEAAPFLKLKSRPDSISISLYGYDDDSYMRYCGRSSCEQVLDTYAQLRRLFPVVGFSRIVGRDNYRDLPKVLELCDRLKPSFLDLVNHLPYLDGGDEGVLRRDDNDILGFIRNSCQDRAYIRSLPTPLDPDCAGGNCHSFERVMNVDGAGNIGGCQRQIPPDPSYGNLFDDVDPFNSSRMKAQRYKMRKKIAAGVQCFHCFGY